MIYAGELRGTRTEQIAAGGVATRPPPARANCSWGGQTPPPDVYIVDLKLGGYAHNVLADDVKTGLLDLLASSACSGLLITLPCAPWAAQRLDQPGPPVLFALVDEHGVDCRDGVQTNDPDIQLKIRIALTPKPCLAAP